MNLARATARDPEEKGQGEHTGARAAVVDSGYFVCRAGFAGDACPRVDVPLRTVISVHRRGCVAYSTEGALAKLVWPIQRGAAL